MLYNTDHGETIATKESNQATQTPAPVEVRPVEGREGRNPAPVQNTPPAYILICRNKSGDVFGVFPSGDIELLTREGLQDIAENATAQNIKESARDILRDIEREERQAKTDRENFQQCRSIADTLDDIASGRAYICPHCHEYHDPATLETHENEDGETVYTCPACGEEIEEDSADQANIFDYFSDCLDIEYITDEKKEYKAVRVCVAWGGPSITVDTDRGAVVLAWWTDTARAFLSSAAVEMVDDFGRNMFESF